MTPLSLGHFGQRRWEPGAGDLVEAGQPIATNSSVFGEAKLVLIAPCEGIVLGMVTHPGVQPGEPVVHLARPRTRIRPIRRALSEILYPDQPTGAGAGEPTGWEIVPT